MGRKIDGRNEDLERLDIIRVSQERDTTRLPDLLRLLRDPETPQNNRRHVVRALGHLGEVSAASELLALLRRESGPILGDAADALRALDAVDAVPHLEKLVDSEEQWISQNATRALRHLRSIKPPMG